MTKKQESQSCESNRTSKPTKTLNFFPYFTNSTEEYLSFLRFDVGDILAQETIPIDANATVVPLTEQLATVGSNLLVKCISNLDFYLERCVPQPEEGVSLGA